MLIDRIINISIVSLNTLKTFESNTVLRIST